jgi:hypothetical protein
VTISARIRRHRHSYENIVYFNAMTTNGPVKPAFLTVTPNRHSRGLQSGFEVLSNGSRRRRDRDDFAPRDNLPPRDDPTDAALSPSPPEQLRFD